MGEHKSRYFTFLLYPESIPEDWLLKLELIGIPMAISPLHDKDKKDGKEKGLKKPHYHIIYIAKNPVTASSVRKRIQRSLGNKSVAMVQIIRTTVENTYLYLTHESKDAVAENKYVYDKESKFIRFSKKNYIEDTKNISGKNQVKFYSVSDFS